MAELLRIEGLSAGYGDAVVIDGIGLALEAGAVWRCWAATAWARPRCSPR